MRPTSMEKLESGSLTIARSRRASSAVARWSNSPLKYDSPSSTRTRGAEAAQRAVALGDGHLKGAALEQAAGIGPQHGADIGARNAHVAALEYDAQLPDPPRAGRLRHLDVGDALQPIPPHVHHRRQGSRQYSAQLLGIPLLAPAKSR